MTLRLGRLHIERDEPALAVPLLRRLLRDEPALEEVVAHLFECHALLGDLLALRRDYRWLQLAYQERYGSPKLSARTVAAYQAAVATMATPEPGGTAVVSPAAS